MEAIKVNLIPNGIPQTCHASQYDEGRQIRLDLFDGFTPYVIKSGDTFTLNVRKPDNHVIVETITGTEGNTYLVIETSEQMTAVMGKNLCEIRVENGGDNIGSLNFIMQVEKDVIANGIPSESVIEDLDALVVEAVGDDFYTKSEVNDLVGGLIDDESTANNKTWSSEKIDEAVDSVQGEIENALTINRFENAQIVEFFEKPQNATIKTNILSGTTDLQLFVGKKNLLVYPYYKGDTFTTHGVTFTVNADKSITANGTADGDATLTINYYVKPNWIPKNKKIYMSGCNGGSNSTYYLSNVQAGVIQTNDEVSFNVGSTGLTINIAIIVKSGTNVTNQVFYPMLSLESGIAYEQAGKLYTATVASGTTSYTWENVTLSEGYNLLACQADDALAVGYTDIRTMSDVYGGMSPLNNHWADKKWVAFGTSITDNWSTNSYITQGDHTGEHTGKYVPYLLDLGEFSTKSFSNRGIAGGSINGHILYYLRYYSADMANADLITIEGAVNDFAASVPLGVVGDTVPFTNALLDDSSADGTFAGACYQAFTTALTNAPNAVVVLLTETTGKNHTGFANYYQLRQNSLGLYQNDYIEMTKKVAAFVGIPVIDCGQDSMINAQNPQYIADHIHHTYLGGYQYARTIWSKLRNIPLKVLALPE